MAYRAVRLGVGSSLLEYSACRQARGSGTILTAQEVHRLSRLRGRKCRGSEDWETSVPSPVYKGSCHTHPRREEYGRALWRCGTSELCEMRERCKMRWSSRLQRPPYICHWLDHIGASSTCHSWGRLPPHGVDVAYVSVSSSRNMSVVKPVSKVRRGRGILSRANEAVDR